MSAHAFPRERRRECPYFKGIRGVFVFPREAESGNARRLGNARASMKTDEAQAFFFAPGALFFLRFRGGKLLTQSPFKPVFICVNKTLTTYNNTYHHNYEQR